MKTVIVKCANWSETVEIDEKIFDDYGSEACTRVIEKKFKEKSCNVSAFLQCVFLKKDKKPGKKLCIYNTYKILINAGFHKKAEILRQIFLKDTKIDLALEPIKG